MATMAAISLPCCSSLISSAKNHVGPRNGTLSFNLPGMKRPASGYGASGAVNRRKRVVQGPVALFGGGDGKKDEKKFITKEQEPEQYWQTADEKEGKNPMLTPLPYIAIMSLLTPFAILAVAFANNWIKLPNQ